MKKPIELTEEEIAILLEILERLQSKGQSLFSHPGELRTIWEIEGKLERATNLAFDERYKEKLAEFLKSKWDARLIKLDLQECLTKKDLLKKLGNEFDFPDYFGLNWDAFDECLGDFCKYNVALLLINRQSASPEVEEELDTLKKCVVEFNAHSEFEIEILE